MDNSYYDLGQRSRSDIVEISLSGSAANVFLVDSSNFNAYRRGKRYTYHGGLATRSPVHLTVPRNGHWYAVINLNGLRGQVRHSMRVLPGRLVPIQERPLASVPSLVQGREDHGGMIEDDEREFDVFISHASEDKDEVVRPLANALRDGGLRVWYDDFELRIGDSLRRKIDKGLASSRFGLVILSKSFFGKGWPNYELDGIVTRAVSGDQVLLPIWHGVTKQEVIKYSPSLVDKIARNTAISTIEEIASEIIEVIRDGA